MEKLRAIIMLEILGKPAEYVKESLVSIIDRLGKFKDVNVIERKVAEPKEIETGVFTTFAEVEIETTLSTLMLVCFEFMPSHVDIVTPEELKSSNADFSAFFTELVRRLHQYDELARVVMMEREILIKQINQASQSPELLRQSDGSGRDMNSIDNVSNNKKYSKNG